MTVEKVVEPIANTLNTALLEVINSVLSAKEFLVDEIPEVVGQLLAWKVAENGISIASFMLSCWCCLLVSRKFIKGFKDLQSSKLPSDDPNFVPTNDPKEIMMTGTGIISAVWGLINIITFFDVFIPSSKNIIMIWVAPKVYLIEYVAEMVK